MSNAVGTKRGQGWADRAARHPGWGAPRLVPPRRLALECLGCLFCTVRGFENLDLAILLAYRLMDSWRASLNVIAVVERTSDTAKAETFLARLVDLARLPAKTHVCVADGTVGRYSPDAPEADLNVFPLRDRLDAAFMWQLRDTTRAACLFTRDSGEENALA